MNISEIYTQKITHIVLIGCLTTNMEFKIQFSIPCFSENESLEIKNKYSIYGKERGYDIVIVKWYD